MPLIQSQDQYECVAKQWRALKVCQRAMQDLASALGKTGADSRDCLEDDLIELDSEIRDLADAMADADEVTSSHEFSVSMGSAGA